MNTNELSAHDVAQWLDQTATPNEALATVSAALLSILEAHSGVMDEQAQAAVHDRLANGGRLVFMLESPPLRLDARLVDGRGTLPLFTATQETGAGDGGGH